MREGHQEKSKHTHTHAAIVDKWCKYKFTQCADRLPCKGKEKELNWLDQWTDPMHRQMVTHTYANRWWRYIQLDQPVASIGVWPDRVSVPLCTAHSLPLVLIDNLYLPPKLKFIALKFEQIFSLLCPVVRCSCSSSSIGQPMCINHRARARQYR